MKTAQLNIFRAWLVAAYAGACLATTLAAQDTNTVELIKQLQRRIDELEQKVQSLEQNRQSEAQAAEAKAKQRTTELEQQLKAKEGEQELARQAKDAQAQQSIADLDQKIKTLEHNRELDKEAAEAKAKELPKITVGRDGFALGSADGNYLLQLKGVLQLDSRTYPNDGGIQGNDTFLLRRARPVLQGTVFRDFDFLFVPDFGGTGGPQIFDAYLNYRYAPELQLRAGKFKSPIGLEALVQDVDTLFNERSLVFGLLPGRDLGVQLLGDLWGGSASYAVGILNGVGDARNSSNADFEDDKALEGRLFFQPFKLSSAPGLKGLGFGVGGSYEGLQGTSASGLPATTGGTLPGYVTDGQQQFFAYNPSNGVVVASGQHWRLSPQAYYYYGPFGFLGEYAISDQTVQRTGIAPLSSARLENKAWQVTGSWILTGEDAVYRGGVSPRRPFNPRQGGWGAFQLVGRYEKLDIDNNAFPLYSDPRFSAHSASAWSAGINWYWNRNFLVKASFSRTEFDGGGGAGTTAPAAVTRQPENVIFTRMQLSF
jgi:phosphate-selective porin OprO/OprP